MKIPICADNAPANSQRLSNKNHTVGIPPFFFFQLYFSVPLYFIYLFIVCVFIHSFTFTFKFQFPLPPVCLVSPHTPPPPLLLLRNPLLNSYPKGTSETSQAIVLA